MGAHERTVTVQPIWYDWQRVIRTGLQTALAFLVGLGGAVGVLQVVAPQVLDAVRDVLPASWVAWLAGAFAFVIAVAGALAKLMAIPIVNRWLTRVHAGSVPKAKALEETADDEPAEPTTAGYPAALKTEPDDALG